MKYLISLLFVTSMSANAATFESEHPEPSLWEQAKEVASEKLSDIKQVDFCFKVEKYAGTVTQAAAGLAAGGIAVDATAAAAGVTAVAHSSTATILTGGAGYVGSSIGSAGAVAVAAAPAAIATGIIVGVGAGSAFIYCQYFN